jgi:hypothetical protein
MELWSDGVLEYWSPLQLLWPPPDALPLMSFSHGSRTPNVERFALAGVTSQGRAAREARFGRASPYLPRLPGRCSHRRYVPLAPTPLLLTGFELG